MLQLATGTRVLIRNEEWLIRSIGPAITITLPNSSHHSSADCRDEILKTQARSPTDTRICLTGRSNTSHSRTINQTREYLAPLAISNRESYHHMARELFATQNKDTQAP